MTNTITRNVAAVCTAFAAVFAVSNVQAAEPTGDVDAHAAIRSQILGAWQPVQPARGAREAELIPALDAHEQARRAVLGLVSRFGNPLRGVASYAPLDNHERARRHILGLAMTGPQQEQGQ